MSPSTFAGKMVVDPKVTLTKLNMNSYFSKETFLACNPRFYNVNEIDYDMSNIFKPSITKDGDLIELKMSGSNKETIHKCLENIASDINKRQKDISKSLIEAKKNELSAYKIELKLVEDFDQHLNIKQIKNLKTDSERFSQDVLYANIVLNNKSHVYRIQDQINKLKYELSPQQTKDADLALPISIRPKSFPSTKLGLLLGLFCGGIFGLFISLVREVNIKLKNTKTL